MAIPKTLFIASPSGFSPAYAFTRAGSAFQINSDGVLESVSTDILRIDHLDLDGDGVRETPTFQLEDGSTNLITRADELDNAAWSANNVTVEADNGEAADGSTGADLIVPSTLTNTHNIGQTLGVTDSADHTLTVYASPGGYEFLSLRVLGNGTANAARAHFELTSSGAVVDSDVLGSGTLTRTEIDRLRDGVYRCTLVGQISTSTALDADFFIAETSSQMATSWAGAGSSGGRGVRLWGAQLEDDLATASSLMLSSAAAASRSADTFDQPIIFTPADLPFTVYIKLNDTGLARVVAAFTGDVITLGAGGNGFIQIDNAAGDYRVVSVGASGGEAGVNLTTGADVTDEVEISIQVDSSFGIIVESSVNGGVITTESLATNPDGAPTSFGGQVIRSTRERQLNIKVASGPKTLTEMRSLNPFFGVLTSSIPVAQDSVDGNRQEIGDRSRTFDGTMRETIRSRVSGWTGTTIPLTQADKNEVQGLLESSTQPQTSFGEMIAGSTGDFPNLFTTITSITPIQSGTQRRYVVAFDVQESS